uniref:SGNH hydrolase-type esterase domain-containing protein n=1 Tax=Leersia perrieri TaxID=77586 RepID=A0A0D9VUB4_9ORYZ
MASKSSFVSLRSMILLLYLLLCTRSTTAAVKSVGYQPGASGGYGLFKLMFAIGDSIADTGNAATLNPNASFNKLSYGETFFGRATGRYCYGRVIVDFLERKEIVSKSMVLLGDIGGNDYNQPFFQNRSFASEIKPLVPKVIAKIENAIKVLIDLGAKTIVVPGNFPIGCVPGYLGLFQGKLGPEDYDVFGCVKWLNDFSEYHNHALKRMLNRIPHDPMVIILYGNYYSTTLEITHHTEIHGKAILGQKEFLCSCMPQAQSHTV